MAMVPFQASFAPGARLTMIWSSWSGTAMEPSQRPEAAGADWAMADWAMANGARSENAAAARVSLMMPIIVDGRWWMVDGVRSLTLAASARAGLLLFGRGGALGRGTAGG